MTHEISIRSKKILRQIGRYLGSASAEQQIFAVYSYLKNLPENQRPDIASECLLRFPDFLDAIERSYAEYEDRIRMISRGLEISSQELNVSNRQLENLNETIRTMLDSLGQGLVFFDKEGVCSSVYSKSCEIIFDVAPGNKKIFEVLGLSPDRTEDFRSWLEIAFSSSTALSFGDLAQLAPNRYINSKQQDIQLEYRSVLNLKNKLGAVLLIATDRTLERKAEESLKETQALSQTIVSIAQSRNEFCGFIRNVGSLLSDMSERDQTDSLVTMREFHTYKGLAYHFGLKNLGDAFHEAEDRIRKAGGQGCVNYSEVFEKIDYELQEAARMAEGLLGKDFLDRGYVRTIELSKIRFLRDKLLEIGDNRCDALKSLIDDEMLGSSVRDCFSLFETEIVRLAGVQGKPVPQISFHSVIHSIITTDYGDFFETLVHLARNIMEHGIEAPDVRRGAGKTEEGHIDIFVSHENAETGQPLLRVVIKDDGRGFQQDILRSRLEALHLHEGAVGDMPDEAVIEYIFHPGFSTQSSVSSLSGRGVGMYALRKSVENLGGYAVPAQRRRVWKSFLTYHVIPRLSDLSTGAGRSAFGENGRNPPFFPANPNLRKSCYPLN